MNWFTLSLVSGILLTIIGIIFIIAGNTMAAVIFLVIGAAFLALDYTPGARNEFSGISKEVLIKKIFGILVLIGAIVLFVLEAGPNLGIF